MHLLTNKGLLGRFFGIVCGKVRSDSHPEVMHSSSHVYIVPVQVDSMYWTCLLQEFNHSTSCTKWASSDGDTGHSLTRICPSCITPIFFLHVSTTLLLEIFISIVEASFKFLLTIPLYTFPLLSCRKHTCSDFWTFRMKPQLEVSKLP